MLTNDGFHFFVAFVFAILLLVAFFFGSALIQKDKRTLNIWTPYVLVAACVPLGWFVAAGIQLLNASLKEIQTVRDIDWNATASMFTAVVAGPALAATLVFGILGYQQKITELAQKDQELKHKQEELELSRRQANTLAKGIKDGKVGNAAELFVAEEALPPVEDEIEGAVEPPEG
jgi:hypothetical protein